MNNAAERARKALDALVYLPSLKGQAITPEAQDAGSGAGLSHHPCRTWDRGDLLRRLHTFKSSTWFCKPAGATPVDCARKGWINVSLDMLSCEFCKARLSLPLPPALPPAEVTKIGREFRGRLSAAHDSGCPWKAAACDPSLAQFPPQDRAVVAAGFAARSAAVGRLNALPPISQDAYARVNALRRSRLQQLLVHGPQRACPQLDMPPEPALEAPAESSTAGATRESQQDGGFRGFHIKRRQQEPSTSTAAFGSQQPSPGMACRGTPEFFRRQNFLALCGWDLRIVRPGSSSTSPGAAHGSARIGQAGSSPGSPGGPEEPVDATRAALRCGMCGARAGLWDFVPKMVPTAQSGRQLGSPTMNGRERAPLVGARVVDLSRTIAGGSLLPDQVPSSSGGISPGPFGRASSEPLSFGAPTREPFARPPNAAVGLAFGSRSASPAPSSSSTTPAATPTPPSSATALSSAPPAVPGASPSGSAPGPFGSAAAAQSPVFGLAAIAAQPSAERAPPAAAASGSGSAAAEGPLGGVFREAPANGGIEATGPFGASTGVSAPIFGLPALQASAASSAASKRPRAPPAQSEQHSPPGKRARLMQPPPSQPSPQQPGSREEEQARPDEQGLGEAKAVSFTFPVLPAAAAAAGGPSRLAFPAAAPARPPPAKKAAPTLQPAADPFSPRGAKLVEPFDPLLFHRPFCPWVNTGSSGSNGSPSGAEPGRCGWRWCLESLVPVPGPEEEREGSPGDDQRSKVAAAIRKLRAR